MSSDVREHHYLVKLKWCLSCESGMFRGGGQFIRQARRVASVVVLSSPPDTRDKSDGAAWFASVKLSPVRICKAMKGRVDPRM